MRTKRLFYLLLLAGSALIISCNNKEKPANVSPRAPQKPALMEPFRYHKMIEVSPGQDYDILSWGRGSAKVGAFEILHSDSAAAKYVTTTGDLDGTIVDVFNTDMDLDGNPEIIIQVKGNDTISYTHIYAFEFTDGKAEKLDFPHLTKPQREGYRGGDDFYVRDGKLIREFPVVDASGKPTGERRQFEYGLSDNNFTIKQLSKDAASSAVAAKPVTESKKNNTESEKHSSEKQHKKKHRRHYSEE